jgi:putative transposase
MIAAETEQGLTRLGVIFENTLPYSPYQNGKQEAFWGQVEGRLLPMLEGVAHLTLDQLNEVSQPWVELEYDRFLNHKNVARACPATEQLELAFTTEVRRNQRRSDGTLTLDGVRFEVPSRFGHLPQLWLRYAAWDLSRVYLADSKTGAILSRIYPVDKTKNAEGRRAPRHAAPTEPAPPAGMAPLLQKIIQQYATTGLPPAYLPDRPTEPAPTPNQTSNTHPS